MPRGWVSLPVIGLCVSLLGGCAEWFLLHPSRGPLEARRIPSQLLESAAASIIVTVAVVLWRTTTMPGMVFWFCLGLYAAARLALQSTREVQDRVGRFNVQYLRCLALICFATIGWMDTR